MSTVLAIGVAIALAVVLPIGFPLLVPFLSDMMRESETGGPILLGLMLAGFSGYVGFASVYSGVRLFPRSNGTAVFWALAALLMVNYATAGWRQYYELGEPLAVVATTTIVGAAASCMGAGIGSGLARSDHQRRL